MRIIIRKSLTDKHLFSFQFWKSTTRLHPFFKFKNENIPLSEYLRLQPLSLVSLIELLVLTNVVIICSTESEHLSTSDDEKDIDLKTIDDDDLFQPIPAKVRYASGRSFLSYFLMLFCQMWFNLQLRQK